MKLLDGLVGSIAGYFYESPYTVGRVKILETSKNIPQYYTLNRPITDLFFYSRGIKSVSKCALLTDEPGPVVALSIMGN